MEEEYTDSNSSSDNLGAFVTLWPTRYLHSAYSDPIAGTWDRHFVSTWSVITPDVSAIFLF